MLCVVNNSCCEHPARGCSSVRRDPVFHVRTAPPLLCELVGTWPDALLGPPALGRERLAVCSVWLGSRLGGGRRNLYASWLFRELSSVLCLCCAFRSSLFLFLFSWCPSCSCSCSLAVQRPTYTYVYAPANRKDKQCFFSELAVVVTSVVGPWVVMGVFNRTREPGDKNIVLLLKCVQFALYFLVCLCCLC